MQVAQRHRLRLARPVARPSIEARLEAIGSQLDEVEAEMARHVEQHHAHMPKLLQSVWHRRVRYRHADRGIPGTRAAEPPTELRAVSRLLKFVAFSPHYPGDRLSMS